VIRPFSAGRVITFAVIAAVVTIGACRRRGVLPSGQCDGRIAIFAPDPGRVDRCSCYGQQ